MITGASVGNGGGGVGWATGVCGSCKTIGDRKSVTMVRVYNYAFLP